MNDFNNTWLYKHNLFYLRVFVLSLFLIGTLELVHGQWQKHTIDPEISETFVICACDVEGDGDMDLFVTEYGASKVLFYENNNRSWTKHIVDAFAGGALGLDLADFDRDGKTDVLVGCYHADVVAWYRNDGGEPITWIKDTIDNSLEGADIVIAEDINGDSDMDAVALGYDSGEIVWYENNYPAKWTKHIIGLNSKYDGVITVEDINNDNKPDVIRAAARLNKLSVYKNNLPNTTWTEIIIDGDLDGAFMACVDDINNDGEMDVVAIARDASGSMADVAWYENDGTGQNWTKHSVTSDLGKASGLNIADINGDEYKDLVVTDVFSGDIITLLNEDGGHIWTEYTVDDKFENLKDVFAFDVDFDNDYDLIPTSEGNHALVWYENPLGSAYADSMEVLPFLIQSHSDTLKVYVNMYNPDSHPVNAWVFINGEQSGFDDTLQLFDDGLHGDGNSSDNLWGNIRLTPDLPEDEYIVRLFTYDSTYGDTLGFRSPARFFTLGPVTYAGYTPAPDFFCGKTSPEPGGCLNLKLSLMNNSSVATATNIKAELYSLDTLISFINNSSSFDDIPAGQSLESNNKYSLLFSDDWQGNADISFVVEISSYGVVCWRDTLVITDVNDIQAPKVNIYPNPTNDLLTIETSQPGQHFIEITSLNGQLLYNDRMEGPTHQIDLSSFEKGVYFITVRSRNQVWTEKIIKQ